MFLVPVIVSLIVVDGDTKWFYSLFASMYPKRFIKIPSPYIFKNAKNRQKYKMFLAILKKEDKLYTFFYYVNKYRIHSSVEEEIKVLMADDSFFTQQRFYYKDLPVLRMERRKTYDQIILTDIHSKWNPFIQRRITILNEGFRGINKIMRSHIGQRLRVLELVDAYWGNL